MMYKKNRVKFKFLFIIVILLLLFFIIKIMITNIYYNEKIIMLEKAAQEFSNVSESEEVKTYYVAVDGKSKDGTNINDPMSLEEANSKIYYGNEKVLFKCGDTFYGTIRFNVRASEKEMFYIGTYGEGDKPIISGANIIIKNNVWEEEEKNLYKLNLSNLENFKGIGYLSSEYYNIGFLFDKNNIYGSRKKEKTSLKDENDFFCENNYLYFVSKENPNERNLSFVSNYNLINVSSNTIIEGLKIENTGGHGIVKKTYPISNVYIKDCIVQNIGGAVSSVSTFSRFGNAIEFWNGAQNILIQKNIVKNSYDAGITFQGHENEFENVIVKDNILISNCYSFELWASQKTKGMKNIKIYNNICINQGNGWGQQVRPNPYNSAEYVFYSFEENASIDININNNIYFNSTRVFYVIYSLTDRFKQKIEIDDNTYFENNEQVYIVNNIRKKNIKEYLNKEYNQDQNSTFKLLTDAQVEQISNPEILNSNDYNEIKTYYEELEKEFEYTELKQEIIEKYNNFLVSNETLLSPINNINNNINSIIGRIEDMTLDTTNEASLKEIINIIYSVESNIIGANVNKNITTTEMIKLINELNELAQNMDIIYSKVEISNLYDKNEITENIQESQNYINSNKDLEIDNLVELSKIGNEISNKEKTTYADYLYAITLSNWTDNVLNTKIKKYIAQNPVTIEYSETNITNKSVKATIKTNAEIQITNNSNSKEYVFDQNGSFTFEYTIKGQAKQITAKVTNIDKTSPIINGVIDGKLYTSKITPTITDENLDTIKLILNGEEVMNFKSGTTLTEEGFYTLTAIDKAGNKTQISFQIMENNNQNYIIQDNIIKNISEQTIKSDFDNKLKLGITYKITRNDEEISNTDSIATGDILTTSAGDKYTIIVTGDMNKDGKLNLKDLVKMRKYLLDGNNLDENEMLSADCNFDGKINLKDLVKMRLMLLNQDATK